MMVWCLVMPAAGTIVNHVFELANFFSAGIHSQCQRRADAEYRVFFNNLIAPTQLTLGVVGAAPLFEGKTYLTDGPYLDEIPGSTAVPSASIGNITLTLGFQAYIATQAYKKGDFVTSSSIGYQSLVDFNVGNTPASSPSDWAVVGFGAPINNGRGFVQSDVGRLIRLFSEPALWATGTTYGSGALVTYNPSNIPGDETYWSSAVTGNIGNIPGTDAAHWNLQAIGGNNSPALWTWGKISGFTSSGAAAAISGATGTNIGNMTGHGGLAAAFDGTTSKSGANSAVDTTSANGDGYVGKNYTGSPNAISQVVVYPSNDDGFAFGLTGAGSITINLWAKSSAPAHPRDGTMLGTSGAFGNTTAAVTIGSNNTVSTWNYVWVEVITPQSGGHSTFTQPCVAQAIFFNASATPSTGVTLSIFGPPLLYAGVTIQQWRLGLYSDTTGWPTVGTYAEGRLWLASAGFPNRIDACVADGISGVNNGDLPGYVNFAPTDQYGNVTEANAIDYTFNAPDANPILWMIPDLQGVLCGTAAGEWIVQAPTTGGISPTNIVARRATVIGCANIEPRRTEHTIIFVQRYLRKVVEYFADVFSGKFTAPNLSKDAKQLTIGNIQEIAYQQELAPIIWARVAGGLIGCTYKRDTLMTSAGPTISAWHQHQLGSNRTILSIVVGSSVNGTLDALMMATEAGAGPTYIEILSPIPDEGSDTLAGAPYLNSAIVPTSTSAIGVSSPSFPYGGLQLNGLWPLNGQTVTAWLGGLDLGDYVVSNGSIQVAYGDGIGNGQGSFPAGTPNRNDQGLFTASFVATGFTANGLDPFIGAMPMLVGFTYTSQGRIVRPNAPAESGARSGPGFGKKRRSHWIMGQFENSQGVSWGTDFSKLKPVQFRYDSGQAYTIEQPFTGIVRDNMSADYNFDNLLCWQVTRPYICNVQAIGAALETQDI